VDLLGMFSAFYGDLEPNSADASFNAFMKITPRKSPRVFPSGQVRIESRIAVTWYVANLTGHDDIVPEEQWPNSEDPRVRLKPVFENGVSCVSIPLSRSGAG
jgi:hypothetical protein